MDTKMILEKIILSNLNSNIKFTNLKKERFTMSNIVNLDAYFEEVDLLKQQINKQVSYITENIQHFNCDPNVKKFLQLATNNCILLCKGSIRRLHELIHSKKLN